MSIIYSTIRQSKDLIILFVYSFFFRRDLSTLKAEKILQITEYVHFLANVIQTFPENITDRGWDFIRIAISSWVLTLSKSSENWKTPQVNIETI